MKPPSRIAQEGGPPLYAIPLEIMLFLDRSHLMHICWVQTLQLKRFWAADAQAQTILVGRLHEIKHVCFTIAPVYVYFGLLGFRSESKKSS